MTRARDLPPRWDGCLVTWEDWNPEPTVFICGRSRRKPHDPNEGRCPHGRGTAREQTWGLVALSPDTTRTDLDYDTENRRLLGRLAHKRPLIATRRLHITRCCHECRQDTVHDIETGETWDLDDSDYGDAGSYDETTHQPALF